MPLFGPAACFFAARVADQKPLPTGAGRRGCARGLRVPQQPPAFRRFAFAEPQSDLAEAHPVVEAGPDLHPVLYRNFLAASCSFHLALPSEAKRQANYERTQQIESVAITLSPNKN